MIKEYDKEIAFSLCNQDIDYAKEIYNCLNPKLKNKIFLYTENQKELVSQIGMEKFRNVFLKKSRIVVVLKASLN